ncbi:MAG: UvrD-helicase domain-containing protein, partial [Deltaproteobacteria bacterium]|nr:UvrD-helicase domain-containing protein [Deltaproteobacteria bacterium]
RVQHILVDEYQDTSRAQLELLKSLTRGWTEGDGRTLFIVGDPMQSIYLFREAEVGLFLDARSNGVGGIRLRPLTLKSNFRSREDLIAWVNGAFTGAFPAVEDPFIGSISYSPSYAVKKGRKGPPKTTLFEKRDDLEEARKVVEIIKGIPPGESSAVLCRSRTHLMEIVEALKREGIDFRADEFDPLSHRAVIQDLFSLLGVLAHPYDRVAWLSALRAPWCGLALSDLHALVTGDKTSPVLSLLEDGSRLSSLSEDGQRRAARFTGKIKKALEKNGRVPVRALLEGLWIELGGPACVREDSEMEDAEEFFGLIESASFQGRGVSLKTLEQRVSKLYASHGGKEGTALELMTIHKAKGLEFDHVIIPGLGKSARVAEKKLLLWMERGEDLLLAPIEKKRGDRESLIYRYLTLINRRKEDIETTRLFYVAATRARKELYLLGHIDGEDDDGIKVRNRSLLSTIRTSQSTDMITGGTADEKERPNEPGNIPLRRLPLAWEAPVPSPPAAIEAFPERGFSEEPVYYWAGETVRHLGTVVHRYLCRIAVESLGGWDPERVEGESGRIRAALRALGLGGKALDEAVLKVVSVVSKALSDGRGRWALAAHPEGSVELPLTGVFGGEVVHAVIDRTFVEDGVRWIIDYKTGSHEGGSMKEFLESEKKRYSAQLERYAAVLRAGGEKREIKKGLYYPALSEWVEL